MSDKIIKSPPIRFAGFTDAWEQRKLGELAQSFDYGLNASATEFDGKNKYLRITDIDDETHEFKNDSLTSPDIDLSMADNYRLQEDDVLFARTGASVGKTYRYKTSDGLVYFAGFLIRARIKSEYDSEFIFQNTLTDSYNRFITITSQRSGQPGVNAQEYADFILSVPEFEEQHQIGTFFNNIDNLITLHQRKLELLKETKKGMLQKMFPKDGESVPEIRFAGFTDAWEQCKLSNVAEYRNGKAHEKDINENGVYIVVNSKFISTNGQVKKFSNKLIEPLKSGEIAFVLSDVPNGKAIARTFLVDVDDKYSLNQRIAGIAPHKDTDSYFLSILMNRNDYFLKFDNGVGQTNLSKSEVENFPEYYPSYEEQSEIGSYFKNLDNLINLHQRELDLLKDLKKSMLKQMFI